MFSLLRVALIELIVVIECFEYEQISFGKNANPTNDSLELMRLLSTSHVLCKHSNITSELAQQT